MGHSFLQKLILVVLAGAMMAGLVEFYKTFVSGADQALNGAYQKPAETPVPTPRKF